MAQKLSSRELRHRRIRKKVSGTGERPRLTVRFTGRHIHAQVIDDSKGVTLVAASTVEKEFASAPASRANAATAVQIGKLVAERSLGRNITKVVFDRAGALYHGRVKALADAAREGGLQF